MTSVLIITLVAALGICIYLFAASKTQKNNYTLLLSQRSELERSLSDLRSTIPTALEVQNTEEEKKKAEEKNKKLWQMSEAVYKEKKKVDEENEKLGAEKEKLTAEKEKLAAEKLKVEDKVKKLWSQSTAIHKEKERINELKIEIEHKHQEIIDSVNYAQRIQRALLASDKLLGENLQDYFIFFQPKDIVSGDFYWASPLANDTFGLVTADSTGHGVPGAIMCMLNISCLKEAIKGQHLTAPNEILNYTRTQIIEHLSNDGSETGGKDGMDCSLIAFDFKNNKLTFSAANNPVWIIRTSGSDGTKSLLEFSPDKMPVGKHDRDTIPFTQKTIELFKGDVVYTLTDGFPDQFGGPKGKKFMYKPLKELVISISHLPMAEQKEKLSSSLNNWKGSLEQIDDVCLIGVRI